MDCITLDTSAVHAGCVSQPLLLVLRTGTPITLNIDLKGQFRPDKPTTILLSHPRVEVKHINLLNWMRHDEALHALDQTIDRGDLCHWKWCLHTISSTYDIL